jgi:hypothetical protein
MLLENEVAQSFLIIPSCRNEMLVKTGYRYYFTNIPSLTRRNNNLWELLKTCFIELNRLNSIYTHLTLEISVFIITKRSLAFFSPARNDTFLNVI